MSSKVPLTPVEWIEAAHADARDDLARRQEALATLRPGRAVGVVDERTFEQLIDLPEGVVVRGVYQAIWLRGWILHLEGEGLPPCEEGCEPQRAYGRVETMRDESGKIWYRLGFDLPE